MGLAQPGDLLARRYRLRGVIGRGGMGVVWLAADELLHRDVAIKEAVRPPGVDDAEWDILRERSLSEARTAARLNHPNIVGVYDILEHDGRPWLVMQLVPFPSLSDVLQQSGPLSPGHAARIGLSVLAAIQAAHSAGVLHRDVKPGNVLLGPDNQVVLADFGLAVTDGSPHATSTGLIIGSPAYMSPERARGEPASWAADLWSLGATLYAAVEGRDPFERNGSAAVLAAVLTDDPDAPSRAGPLWPVISGLLDKDPRQRLTTDQAQWMLQPVAETDDAPYLFDDATQLAPASHTAVLQVPPYLERTTRQRRLRGPVAIFLASVAAVALGASLAAGALAGHHAAAPAVTRSPSAARSPKPDPTPSDAGYSYPPWQSGDKQGKHHGWYHGHGNGNQDQYGDGYGHGNGDGNGNGNGA
ncbi:MAG TPA: serine/threonine-protein kinase [Streptosporangiaceae bacterium]|nr:serine/threonine-protein kinase [Streptosporangiaceae bacterium]